MKVTEKITKKEEIKEETEKKKMRTMCSRVPFNEYDFMRLFIAMLSFHEQLTLDVDNLGYRLYRYHGMEEYRILLQDFAVKQQIEGSFFKVENAVQTAILGSLLSFHYISATSSNRLINIQKEEAKEIISSYDSETVDKMDSLTKDFISCYTKAKQKVK